MRTIRTSCQPVVLVGWRLTWPEAVQAVPWPCTWPVFFGVFAVLVPRYSTLKDTPSEPTRSRTWARATGYWEVRQITGLIAVAPLGRSRTCPVDPSARVLVTTFAPLLRVQPAPLKPSGAWPGASEYQLKS